MSRLASFEQRVQERIAASSRAPHWPYDESHHSMPAVRERRQQSAARATRLTRDVMRPRLEVFAENFSNAKMLPMDVPGRCACWLGYCERFPTSSRLSLSVTHDVRIEHVQIGFDASMMPQFFPFNEHDKKTSTLDRMNDQEAAEWVEVRLLEFLDSYLRIERGGEDGESNTTIDPVCGMPVRRPLAIQRDYRGHDYYFCSDACATEFARNPAAYAEVRTTT